jgi:ParB family chromosome partitioning protein
MQMVALVKISLPSSQPRRDFNPEKMEQLIESVRIHGILENLIVRPIPKYEEQYELVAGERRYRAAIAAGLTEVPVTIRSLTDEQALALALVENLTREDLNCIDETEGILQLLALKLKLKTEEVIAFLYRMMDESKGKVKGKAQKAPQNVLGNEHKTVVETVFAEVGKLTWESFVSSRLPLGSLLFPAVCRY